MWIINARKRGPNSNQSLNLSRVAFFLSSFLYSLLISNQKRKIAISVAKSRSGRTSIRGWILEWTPCNTFFLHLLVTLICDSLLEYHPKRATRSAVLTSRWNTGPETELISAKLKVTCILSFGAGVPTDRNEFSFFSGHSSVWSTRSTGRRDYTSTGNMSLSEYNHRKRTKPLNNNVPPYLRNLLVTATLWPSSAFVRHVKGTSTIRYQSFEHEQDTYHSASFPSEPPWTVPISQQYSVHWHRSRVSLFLSLAPCSRTYQMWSRDWSGAARRWQLRAAGTRVKCWPQTRETRVYVRS